MGNSVESTFGDFRRRRLAEAVQDVRTQGGYCPVRGQDAHDKKRETDSGTVQPWRTEERRTGGR